MGERQGSSKETKKAAAKCTELGGGGKRLKFKGLDCTTKCFKGKRYAKANQKHGQYVGRTRSRAMVTQQV